MKSTASLTRYLYNRRFRSEVVFRSKGSIPSRNTLISGQKFATLQPINCFHNLIRKTTTITKPTSSQTLTTQSEMSIHILDTPNPESLKFLPGRPVLTSDLKGDSSTMTGFYVTVKDTADMARSPLAKLLFAIEGVKGVYLGPDFITVTKRAEVNWSHVRTSILSAIMNHYSSGKPALSSTTKITDTTILEDDDEVVAMIKELLEARIRPAVQEDGGDIRYVGFNVETGIVNVQLAGSCVGCPSSSVTLKNGVENMLMHYIPEVTGVEAIEEDEERGGSSVSKEDEKARTYEERLRSAGIPFSD